MEIFSFTPSPTNIFSIKIYTQKKSSLVEFTILFKCLEGLKKYNQLNVCTFLKLGVGVKGDQSIFPT